MKSVPPYLEVVLLGISPHQQVERGVDVRAGACCRGVHIQLVLRRIQCQHIRPDKAYSANMVAQRRCDSAKGRA